MMKSVLSIFDIETGLSETALSLKKHIEAPNWTPDGANLIVNGGGRLYRVPMHAPELQLIDTGFAVELNNDHGISPDGKLLVISDRTRTEGSCIYILPIEGGEPERITQNIPSYWHGWSPDGKVLAYAARRRDNFQIYTCPVAGGEETQLTLDFLHCDGPDYTPDGNWIWFNGEHSEGDVQLWRIRPDGRDLQQMTNDKRVNWFPHPSPDGNHLVYLSYEPGTWGHPANRQVELRLIPIGDEVGATPSPRILNTFVGGQGTINVPSWAPDSRRFAYVHYEDVEIA